MQPINTKLSQGKEPMAGEQSYYRYWGKASKDDSGEFRCHLLPYHSLDVAQMAACWLENSSVLRGRLATMTHCSIKKSVAWVLFFVALHDLGKFDIRFQLKVPAVLNTFWGGSSGNLPDNIISRNYWHGEYAAYWAYHDLADRLQWKLNEDMPWDEPVGVEIWAAWQPWIRAVAGHHGMEPSSAKEPDGQPPLALPEIAEQDCKARLAFIEAMEELFLKPAALSLEDTPPPCDLEFIAGFCSVCDWLGSTTENRDGQSRFTYCEVPGDLAQYFQSRKSIAETLLDESGLLGCTVTAGGMADVFPQFDCPRQVQTLVDELPVEAGLTLIESPTGSGKTEAALAYAARLLVAGQAESIIFALPTQATADAMLNRLTEVAIRLFDNADVVLAHGKSRFNPAFINLKKKAGKSTANSVREREAGVQCAHWLAQSRKRVFLGQIGVCTVDQVLISVLPVRHRFVRGFGLGKSVLIIDEVHAYDAYMYGLLDRVLRHQNAMGGSAVLLSATLPLGLRHALLNSWDVSGDVLNSANDYPLVTQVQGKQARMYPLPDAEKQRLAEEKRVVHLEQLETGDMLPDDDLLARIVRAADAGANVVVICNLVADAQKLAERLSDLTPRDILLFHSRYRFKDRQRIQQQVMSRFGKSGQRIQGGILVATQVVEQSLDLDFDWMITQLSPVDLLFQRLGRLHRHERKRPTGFEKAACTVLVPVDNQYELHKLIYGNGKASNSRVLWRTEQIVRQHSQLCFPDVYRPLIESVYEEESWDDEPREIVQEYEKYWQAQYASRSVARQISDIENAWPDDDSHVNLLTRDGEMSLSIVPVEETADGLCLLGDDTPVAQLEGWEQAELVMRNTLPAPASWRNLGLPEAAKQDGLIWLVMEADGMDGWRFSTRKAVFDYDRKYGLRMTRNESTH